MQTSDLFLAFATNFFKFKILQTPMLDENMEEIDGSTKENSNADDAMETNTETG